MLDKTLAMGISFVVVFLVAVYIAFTWGQKTGYQQGYDKGKGEAMTQVQASTTPEPVNPLDSATTNPLDKVKYNPFR